MTKTVAKFSGFLAAALVGLAAGTAHAATYTGTTSDFFDIVTYLSPGKYRTALTVSGPLSQTFGTGLTLTHFREITDAHTGDLIESTFDEGLAANPLAIKREDHREFATYVVPEPSVEPQLFGDLEVNVAHSYSGSLFLNLFSTDGTPLTYTLRIEQVAAIPEPAAWGVMIAGFGVAGAFLRRRQALAEVG